MYVNMPSYNQVFDMLVNDEEFYIEMTRKEAGVLCGLIEKIHPMKIVEVGVAAGGSTCLILKCLELLGMSETEVISIDINEKFYRGEDKKTGYLLTENKDKYNADKHKFILGKYAVECMEEVGDDVDLLFLDTVHSMPGEILDFLLLYPRLSESAVVVLHDANLHTIRGDYAMANRVLVNSVSAIKFYNNEYEYLNIGAFQINSDTKNYIEDVFATLLLPWNYIPEQGLLQMYEEEFRNNYSCRAVEIWKNAIECAMRRFEILNGRCLKQTERQIKRALLNRKSIYIYGCGYRGKKLLNYMKQKGYAVSGMIVSDEISLDDVKDVQIKVKHYSDILKEIDSCVVFLATAAVQVKNVLEGSPLQYVELEDSFYNII